MSILRWMVISVAVLTPLVVWAAGGWQEVDRGDAYVLYASHHPSGFERLKLVGKVSHPYSRLCQVVWGDGTIRSGEEHIKVRQILESTADYRVSYEQVSAPVVSDRDYVVEYRRETQANGCRFTFKTRNDKGPAPKDGFVRITRIEGEIVFTAATPTATDVTYVQWTDPAGSIPPFVVRGARRSDVIAWMDQIAQWAAQK